MGIIKKLDPELIKRIAAGEVIERPSSIVKELLENAIDAGANRITVELSSGGLTSIKVTDNGIGIASDDVPLLIDRHVTSKIHDIDDLEMVGTLGFRGEALYSIASVARFTLRTRHRGEDAGTELSFVDGEKRTRTIPHPVGTSVEATSIFYNTPARRKFLKTASSEYARCAEVVTRYALAYPQVAFELTHDGRLNLQTTGGGVQDVLLAVFGKSEAVHFIPVHFRDQRVGITGQISDPSLTRTTRKDQTFTINGRVVFDIALNLAFERAYSKLIAEGKRPLCILDVTIDPASVDVNVHPHKREVRLSAPRAVYDAIQRACNEALHREIGDLHIPDDELPQGVQEPVTTSTTTSLKEYEGVDVGESTSFVAFKPKQKSPVTMEQLLDELESKRKAERVQREAIPIAFDEPIEPEKQKDVTPDIPPPTRVRDIMQVNNTYLIINRGDMVFIADQHNLHETILYREMKNAGDKGVVSQKLLFPVTVEFTPEVSAIINEKADFLNRMGYELEDFGGGTYIIRALPHFLPPEDPKEHLLDLFDEVGDVKGDDFDEKFIIGASCRAAIKAGKRLTPEEMRSLASNIIGPRGFNCPHGRPAVIALDGEWFARTFKRPIR
jgi:DNA mismatch repair protein MutL